jgi:hypothetical protein
MFQIWYTIQKCSRHAVGQQLAHCPNMIGQPSCHRGRDRAPASRRTISPRRFGADQALAQTIVRQHQMIVGQCKPQLLFQPGHFFAKATRLRVRRRLRWRSVKFSRSTKLVLIIVLALEVRSRA